MNAPFQISILLTKESGGVTAEMGCSMEREDLIEYLIANEKKGFAVPTKGAAKALGFFIVSFLQNSCPCPGCLMEATGLTENKAKKALGELADLGYLIGVTEETLQ